MEKQTFAMVNRVANRLFLATCCAGENTELSNYYDGGLDLIESLISERADV